MCSIPNKDSQSGGFAWFNNCEEGSSVQATNGSGFFHFIEVTFTDNGQWAKIVPPYRVPQYERKKEKKKKKKKEEKRKRKRRIKEKKKRR